MPSYMTKGEATRRRALFRAVSGMVDFFASVGSFVIIMLCIALLTQLFVWFRKDITQTMYSLGTVAQSAIVQPETMADQPLVGQQ